MGFLACHLAGCWTEQSAKSERLSPLDNSTFKARRTSTIAVSGERLGICGVRERAFFIHSPFAAIK